MGLGDIHDATVGDVLVIMSALVEPYWVNIDDSASIVDALHGFGLLSSEGYKDYGLEDYKNLYEEHAPEDLDSTVERKLKDNKYIMKNWLQAVSQYRAELEEAVEQGESLATGANEAYGEYVNNTHDILSALLNAIEIAETTVKGLYHGSISLSGHGIDDACMALIADTVDFDVLGNAVTSLDLSNNKLGPDGLRAILKHFDARDANGNRMHGLSISSIIVSGNERITDREVEELIKEFPDILDDNLFQASITIFSSTSLGVGNDD